MSIRLLGVQQCYKILCCMIGIRELSINTDYGDTARTMQNGQINIASQILTLTLWTLKGVRLA